MMHAELGLCFDGQIGENWLEAPWFQILSNCALCTKQEQYVCLDLVLCSR